MASDVYLKFKLDSSVNTLTKSFGKYYFFKIKSEFSLGYY